MANAKPRGRQPSRASRTGRRAHALRVPDGAAPPQRAGDGAYRVEGNAVALTSIGQPMPVVGTEGDPVSPSRSVHRVHHLCDAAITFVLTSGGHNAGIVSAPGHGNRHLQIAARSDDGAWIKPDGWQARGRQRAFLMAGPARVAGAPRRSASACTAEPAEAVVGDTPWQDVRQRDSNRLQRQQVAARGLATRRKRPCRHAGRSRRRWFAAAQHLYSRRASRVTLSWASFRHQMSVFTTNFV